MLNYSELRAVIVKPGFHFESRWPRFNVGNRQNMLHVREYIFTHNTLI